MIHHLGEHYIPKYQPPTPESLVDWIIYSSTLLHHSKHLLHNWLFWWHLYLGKENRCIHTFCWEGLACCYWLYQTSWEKRRMCSVTSMGEQGTAQRWSYSSYHRWSKKEQSEKKGCRSLLAFQSHHSAQNNLSPALSLSHSIWSCRYSSPSSPDFFFPHIVRPGEHISTFPMCCILSSYADGPSPRGCPILNHEPIGKRVSSQVAGRKSSARSIPNLYLTVNIFGLERSLGMALMWPRGLG